MALLFQVILFHIKDSGIYSIYMEIMDTSLDKFYKCVYDTYEERIPETILGQILIATLNALSYLKDSLKTIHRGNSSQNAFKLTEQNSKTFYCWFQ
jgi:hypothetical protein